MKFVDYVTITVRSGKGGPGCVAFRRAKYEPKGGPAGGDGGRGGSIILEADAHLYTLLDLRYNRHHFARNGEPGQGSKKAGKDAEDIVLRVPPGTLAYDTDTNEPLGELMEPGDRLVLAQGGKGGRGNVHFKSSTNQAPRYAQPGEAGEEANVTLELKLLADVGLVGFPNAGKSTLISSISAAKPKIADYPFTTLEPALGVVYVEAYQSFVMADLPGIIEGAHEGKGLGDRFLKHIERNAVLLFVIPVTDEDPAAEYRVLLHELHQFNADMLYKPRIVALSKIDLLAPDEREARLADLIAAFPSEVEVLPLSAVAQQGLEPLKRALWRHIQAARNEDPGLTAHQN
ncbi:MAG: GTPase ObgE [Bacteroidota bacterium]